MKHIYLFFSITAMFCSAPAFAANVEPEMEPGTEIEAPAEFNFFDDDKEGIENEINGIRIEVNGKELRVNNAAGKTLEVYNLAGVRVLSVRIDSDEKTVNLNLQKGCYMIKVDKFVRKISIR